MQRRALAESGAYMECFGTAVMETFSWRPSQAIAHLL